jgi:hypothetical protein
MRVPRDINQPEAIRKILECFDLHSRPPPGFASVASGMPICPAAQETPITQPVLLGTHFHRPVNVAFDQPDSSSDAGAVLLRNVRCLILV